MRLRQFYDVGYYEATYNVKNKIFNFQFNDDEVAIVRAFPLEDYKKIDQEKKLENYNLGVLYINTENETLVKDSDEVFKSIPSECDKNIYSKNEDINVKIYKKLMKNIYLIL